MGKIANALGKYTQERQAARLPKLTRPDRVALTSYNRKTGHIVNDETGDDRDNHSLEVLKNRGIFQRLLNHSLILPSGELTPKGVSAVERLEKMIPARQPAADNNMKNKEKITEGIGTIGTDDIIIGLEEEVETVGPSSVTGASTKKVLPLVSRPIALKSRSTPQPEVKEASTIPPPTVEETVIEHGNQANAAGPDMPDKMNDKKAEDDWSPAPMPGVSNNDKMLYKNLVSLVDPESYEAEQFKILRNSILFPITGAVPQSILVTSSLQGEGKSFVSANLAISIAMNVNKHVLLIDCDLRKPDLHRVFGVGDVPGLSNYLAERRSLDSLFVKTAVEKLTLLPGGPITPNPSELASSDQMSAMLDEVKYRYKDRIIVIDSPPPGLAAETSFLARQADGIIVVVKYGKTPREDVEDLMDTVGSDKIIGAVINHLDMPMSKRYGYGKYGRYGGYGRGKK